MTRVPPRSTAMHLSSEHHDLSTFRNLSETRSTASPFFRKPEIQVRVTPHNPTSVSLAVQQSAADQHAHIQAKSVETQSGQHFLSFSADVCSNQLYSVTKGSSVKAWVAKSALGQKKRSEHHFFKVCTDLIQHLHLRNNFQPASLWPASSNTNFVANSLLPSRPTSV